MILELSSIFCVIIFSISSAANVGSIKKTVVITGANSGVGLAATKILAASNEWNVIMACRNLRKAEESRSSIQYGKENTEVLELDLADLASVRKFADVVKLRNIDCLACNAGLQESTSGLGGKENGAVIERTKQGYEVTVGTNHIGHFLLANLLVDYIKTTSTENGRIVFTASGVHDPDSPGGNVGSKASYGNMKGLELGFREPISMIDNGGYDPDKAYKDSKLCNVMTAIEFARRLKAKKSTLTCNSFNPGLVPTTGLFSKFSKLFVTIFAFLTLYVFRVAVTEEEGGRCLAFMISNPSLNGLSGGYFSAVPGIKGKEFGIATPSTAAMDETEGLRLWKFTEKLVMS